MRLGALSGPVVKHDRKCSCASVLLQQINRIYAKSNSGSNSAQVFQWEGKHLSGNFWFMSTVGVIVVIGGIVTGLLFGVTGQTHTSCSKGEVGYTTLVSSGYNIKLKKDDGSGRLLQITEFEACLTLQQEKVLGDPKKGLARTDSYLLGFSDHPDNSCKDVERALNFYLTSVFVSSQTWANTPGEQSPITMCKWAQVY